MTTTSIVTTTATVTIPTTTPEKNTNFVTIPGAIQYGVPTTEDYYNHHQ